MFRLIVRHSYLKVINKSGNVQRSTEERSQNHSSSGKAVSITYSDCVFITSGIQQAMGMRHIFICGLPDPTIIFSTLSPKRQDFRLKIAAYEMCVLIFTTTFVRNISHSKN
jgi:hypothetical protein